MFKDMKSSEDPSHFPSAEQARIAALERRIAELDAFTYTVAHQLRAPLQAMNGFARRLQLDDASSLSPKARSRLDRIAAAALKMEQTIDDLLMLARADRFELEKEPLATEEIVREVLAELRGPYPATRVMTSELPHVHADPVVVRQVFVNLIGNALKFSHLADAPRIEIGLATDGAFHVRDNGIGFGMDKAGALFEPFERLTGNADYPGTGVGLAIVRRLIERHGGWVQAQSREGGPTEFRFSFGND